MDYLLAMTHTRSEVWQTPIFTRNWSPKIIVSHSNPIEGEEAACKTISMERVLFYFIYLFIAALNRFLSPSTHAHTPQPWSSETPD